MAIVSAKLVDGERAVYSTFNNLREDLLVNHVHDGSAGAKIDHKDMTESAAMSGKVCTHGNIDTHIQGTEGAFDDDPGYNQGVHGLNAAVYVVGSGGAQLVIQTGTVSIDPSDSCDTVYDSGEPDHHQAYGYYKEVTFTVAYGSAPLVFVSLGNPPAGDMYEAALNEWQVAPTVPWATSTATKIKVYVSGYNRGDEADETVVNWLAIGTVAK